MKKIVLILVIAMVTSCASQKKALEAQNQLLQNQVALQQQEIEQQRMESERQRRILEEQQQMEAEKKVRPTRKLREQEPCEELALAESDNLRALGTTITNIEKVGRNEALRDARNQLAQMIKVAVEGAAMDYEQNANRDLKVTTELLSEAVISQYLAQDIANSEAIKWSVYDLSDDGIQVYVCIEMKKNLDDVMNELKNQLDRDEVIEVMADRDRFINKTKEGLENYKRELKAEVNNY